jgi:long-chain acyl-CoA synthetase
MDPDRAAAIMHSTGERLTFAELEAHSIQLARALREAGLHTGDHIAMLALNDMRCFEVYWAALRSGLYVTAVNRHLTKDEIAYIVEDCAARVLICSAELADRAPAVERLLTFDGTYEAFRDAVSAEPLAEQPRGADMLYSSGTTGRPKGIKPPLPDESFEQYESELVVLCRAAWGFGGDTVYLSPGPIYHAAPLRFGAVVQALGGTVVVMDRFDATESLRALEQHRVTHSQWVPTMFVRMLKLPDEVRESFDLSAHRVAIHAAAPCPPEVKDAMLAWWGPIIHEYYAATEGNGLTLVGPQDWIAHRGSVGRAAIGIVRICGPDGQVLPTGEIGTVYFERDELPFRYHDDDAKTEAAQHPEHPDWTTTGDIGYLDDEGYHYLTDRAAFVIISGGVNVYPQEVEGCLALHPDVLDVAVIGVPDDDLGESVTAFVSTPPGVVPSVELGRELIDYTRARIAHFKCPREVRFVEEVPRTPAGKLAKHRLVAQLRS